MFDIQNYYSFVMAVIVFQLIPGAGTVAILNASARRGVRGGMKAVLGTLTGDCVYMFAAVLGVAAILSAHPAVLDGAQWLGVGYLFWLGLMQLFAGYANSEMESDIEKDWAYYRQALAISLTNPKVILFFMAFFPLFLRPESTSATLAVLMLHVTCISLVYQTLLVITGNAAARRLSRWQYAPLIAKRMAGLALIGFSIKLAFSNR